MCGIAALIEPAAPVWLAKTVARMTRAVRHRGPDGEGFAYFHPAGGAVTAVASDDSPRGVTGPCEPPAGVTAGLGHRRLSILDLSTAGHQPMRDAAGDCWITFNGEIYNYVELRAELAAAGHAFHTGTDTEVILAAWRAWGEDCLPRFNGMFAFVLLDRPTRRIFAARDRFGEKPLYLWATPTGGLALASEIKQFAAHPQWQARLNGQRAYEFLNWGVSDHTAETLFAGVRQLRGGECLSAPLDAPAAAPPRRWYTVQPAPFAGTFADAAAQFRALLDDAVRLRLRADVAVGSCLSGGLDSSALVCTMRAQLGDRAAGRQHTFSAGSDVPRYDERAFIAQVVAAAGTSSHTVVPSAEGLLEELERVAWHQDEPFGSTSIYAQWCVCRLARERGVTVMLDGQGADEALGGYHGYFGPHLAGLLRRGRWGEFRREAAAARTLHGHSRGLQAQLVANELLPAAVSDLLRRMSGRTVRAPAHLDLARLGARPAAPLTPALDYRTPIRSLGLAQLTALNLPMLLHYEDRNAMAHGVEARLPFLDHRLVEFGLGLPEEYKLAGGWTKRVLREAMRDRLPEPVRLRRDKLGFATAEEVWLREWRPVEFRRLLAQAVAIADGALTPAALARYDRVMAGGERFNFALWRMISFGTWLRRFDVRPG
jgi:asparagine synthase (glutamine-hydrolysing)